MLYAEGLDHVGREDLFTAVFSLAHILAPGGRLILTFSTASDRAVPLGKLMLLFASTGFTVSDRQSLPDRNEALLWPRSRRWR